MLFQIIFKKLIILQKIIGTSSLVPIFDVLLTKFIKNFLLFILIYSVFIISICECFLIKNNLTKKNY